MNRDKSSTDGDREPLRSPSGESASEKAGKDDDSKSPIEMRDPLLRDRIRTQLDVTHQQWYVIETFLLVIPYPFFVVFYLLFNINDMLFIGITLVYSLFAMYVGFLS